MADDQTGPEIEELDDSIDEVVLIDPEGNEVTFSILAVLEMTDEGDFALLTPSDQLHADDDTPMDVYVFRYEVDEDGTENFLALEDEKLLEQVAAVAGPLLEGDDAEE
jgi:uncharacterized protein YrzB (UPF0473 family)